MDQMKKFLQVISFAPAFILSQPTYAAGTDISNEPLFLGGAIEPNIMLLFDDSGSMHWESLPDDGRTRYLFPRASDVYDGDVYSNRAPAFADDASYNVRIRSSYANPLYYNPAIRYTPWLTSDGGTMADASITCAPHNPAHTSAGCRNLTEINEQSSDWDHYDGPGPDLIDADFNFLGTTSEDETREFWPAVYYRYSGTEGDEAQEWDADNYEKVEIRDADASYTGGSEREDCTGEGDDDPTTCTYAQEIQNFANWYSYYRSRVLLARNGIGKAFADQTSGIRVGFAALNKASETIDGVSSGGALVNGVRKFDTTNKADFFDTLYEYPIGLNSTPSRRALDLVGKYFERDDDRGPWSLTPGTENAEAHYECRQSFTVLMTDGYWSEDLLFGDGSAAVTADARGNVDNEAGEIIVGHANPSPAPYQYSPTSPYSDTTDGTLADVAMYYWKRDLRTDVQNKVPTNPRDEAFWQHMVTYAVGLGVNGTLDPDVDLPALISGEKSWPQRELDDDDNLIFPNGPEKVDDLWHAALNSRGDYFSAANPTDFANQLKATLSSISQRVSSAAAIATNSTRLNSSTFVYQARFDPSDWHGQFLAYQINPNNGNVAETSTWDARNAIPAADARTILSYDPDITDAESGDVVGGGVSFEWGDGGLSDDQKAALDPDADGFGEERLAWLRGDASNEGRFNGTFRNRTNGVLGDIVNSDPWRVAQDNFGYHILPEGEPEQAEGSTYTEFRETDSYRQRSKVIYVGSNDGMLHAFDAGTWNSTTQTFDEGTGAEKFAYIPNAVISNLHELTDPDYSHLYFVDGPARASDAFIPVDAEGNLAWRTVLVGTLGAGGKAVFALDVTDPDNMDPTKVLWELSDDTDLGYTLGQPTVARMYNGNWAAIFGNGYDSDSGEAVLFIKDLTTGTVYKLGTGAGASDNKNGLSTPTAIDINNDGIVDAIYAGDLFGNLWKFDVSSANENQWGSAFTQGGTPEPLFAATDSSARVQPITAKVDVGAHPNGGVMVYFGTGKYFEIGDNTYDEDTDPVHSLYGIWDDGVGDLGRSDLQAQQILIEETLKDDEGNDLDYNIRVTSSNAVHYVDPDPDDEETVELKSGWYMDLVSPTDSSIVTDEEGNPLLDDEGNPVVSVADDDWEKNGERVVSAPILHDGRVLFTTMIPAENPCDYGGTSWSMDLTAIDGSRPSVSPFDFNNDGVFDADDYHLWDQGDDDSGNDYSLMVSGKQSKVGITKTPAVIRVGDREYRYAGGSDGGIEKTVGARSAKTGRQSWWQIR